jgi:hypothetical protein
MNTSDKRASTLREFCARNSVSRSFAYEEHHRGRLKITKAGKKSLILNEDEEAWRASLPALESRASAELLEQVAVADDWQQVLEIASRFVQAIANLPTHKRDRLTEHFIDLCAQRDLRSP